MEWDFDKIIDRAKTGSIKGDYNLCSEVFPELPKDDWVPMWVADMDFETPPVITEALKNRTNHKIYGYTKIEEDFYKAVENWYQTRHGLKDLKVGCENFIPFPGIVCALSVCIRALTEKKDGIIILQPVYNPFHSVITENKRELINSPLINTDGNYSINFLDLEKKAKNEKAKMMILCSPHNPVGRVWTRPELEEILRICYENNIILISDEIHSDLVFGDKKHHSILSFDKKYQSNIVLLDSITKTFNLAGLGLGYSLIMNNELQKKVADENEKYHWAPNIFSIEATKAAYSEKGAEWVEDLNLYLKENFSYIEKFTEENLKKAVLTPIEGTYLAWLDCRGYNIDHDNLLKAMTEEGVALSSGAVYGEEGEGFLRINFATPLENVKNGMGKIKAALEKSR